MPVAPKIRQVDDIPEDIYSVFPTFIYNAWETPFIRLSEYANKIEHKEIELPIENEIIHKRCHKIDLYIKKVIQDPLDLTYELYFRVIIRNFNSEINKLMSKYDMDFDFNLLYDKHKLLSFIGNDLSKILNHKIVLTINSRYIVFTAKIDIQTQHDRIEMLY